MMFRHGCGVTFHSVLPFPNKYGCSHKVLLYVSLMRGDCRIRLLNFISKSPIDCPVAVVFGHACAMNWVGPAYNDLGIGLSLAQKKTL